MTTAPRHTVSSFPRIVRIVGNFESDTCPHCGARGRYVTAFETDDGRHLAAMAGCIRLFPVSPIASEHLRLMKKLEACNRTGRRLNRWDLASLDAIEAFYAGTMNEDAALCVVKAQRSAASAWRSGRFGR